MPTSNEKGDALERAVHAIERAILSHTSGLQEKTFRIERKKIINEGGSHHEIDVFVTVDIGPGYQAVFIFECKNWKDAVNKNEIIVFAHKIEAAKAQRGFFVAPSLTADAHAQAAQDERIVILESVEYPPDLVQLPFDFHMSSTRGELLNIRLTERGRKGASRGELTLDVNAAEAVVDGVRMPITAYTQPWGEALQKEDTHPNATVQLTPGVHSRSVTDTRTFEEGAFIVDGRDIERAVVTLTYDLQIDRPQVVSKFEVATRGRLITLAQVIQAGVAIDVSVVETFAKSSE